MCLITSFVYIETAISKPEKSKPSLSKYRKQSGRRNKEVYQKYEDMKMT